MSIASRQKLKETNLALKTLLQKGRFPSLSEILSTIRSRVNVQKWGEPTAQLRPAVHGYPIGGKDGKDIERTFTELRSDLEVLYEENIAVSESLLSTYQTFSSENKFLNKKLSGLSQKLDSLLSYMSKGCRHVFFDSFENTDKINLSASTIEVDIEEGSIILPRAKSTLSPYNLSKASIVSENIQGTGKLLSSIKGALSDSTNSLWQASLNGGSYEVIFNLNGIDPTHPNDRLHKINAFYMDPAGSFYVEMYYSNDSYNYYNLFSGNIDSAKTWSFEAVQASHLKLIIKGNDVGIKKMRPLVINYDNLGTFYSTPLIAEDSVGNKLSIQSASIDISTETPFGTVITPYIMPCSYDGVPLGTWYKIDKNIISMSRLANEVIDIYTSVEDDEADLKFYYSALPENIAIDGTEELIKGNNQFFVEYFNYDWSIEDDTSHVLLPTDFERFSKEIKSGFFGPLAYTDNASALGAYDYMKSNQNMLCEIDMSETSTSTVQRGWLVIGIKDGSGSSLLVPNGNYRFTLYVYCPENIMLKDRPVLVYNPDLYGGAGTPEVAPFSIYLNDSRIFYSKKSFTSLDSTSLFNYRVSYPFIKGWNKLEIYLYYPETPIVDSDSTVSPCNIGLYMNPNILTFDSSLYKLQGTKGKQQKVSEFILRYCTPPKVNNTWALIPATETVGLPEILLNYDPSKATTASNFDGLNIPQATKLSFAYSKLSQSQPIEVGSLILRIDLEKNLTTNATPKVFGYTLYVN